MKFVRQHAVALLFVAASFAVVIALYGRMPERVPIHWNLRGEVDGTMSKPWGPFLIPLTAAAVTALLAALPALSPKEASLEKFGRVFRIIVAAEAGFLLFLTVIVSMASVGFQLDVGNAVCAAAGVLFAIIGNFMGKFTPNYFAGIRTPWTLSNDEVWLRTHRLGGKLFVAAGLVTLVAALAGHGTGAMLATLFVVTVISVGYSYVIYQRIAR